MRKSYIYVLISTVMFSSMEIALKIAGNQFSPIQLNLIRFFIGGIVLLPFAIKSMHKQNLKIKMSDWKVFFLTGLFCVIVSMSLYQMSILYDDPGIVAVLFSSNPLFALIFSYLILNEKISRTNFISLIVSLLGLVVIVNPFNLSHPIGLFLGLLSALTFGFYSIFSRYESFKHNFDGITLTSFTFIAGSIELLIVIGATHIPTIANFLESSKGLKVFANTPILQNVNLSNLPIILFTGICVTGGGFAFYFLAMQEAGVSIASLVFFIKPGLAPILAMLLIGEKISLTVWIGIVIILIGSVITFIGNRNEEKDSDILSEKDV
ncbi:EamA family transporter [Lactobacillus sp. S2-2]|uniref:DMT family transporter n=1 Tax=Lactobacillus sp. S2-2 TaxID=2692917 RepID=UPI001F3F475E|nr:DMT family transporter [Lactobacillus sp. S2-2]MCF6515633.1 EamA family transporter [Lactobacillus sp. S2-2]